MGKGSDKGQAIHYPKQVTKSPLSFQDGPWCWSWGQDLHLEPLFKALEIYCLLGEACRKVCNAVSRHLAPYVHRQLFLEDQLGVLQLHYILCPSSSDRELEKLNLLRFFPEVKPCWIPKDARFVFLGFSPLFFLYKYSSFWSGVVELNDP